MVSANARPVLIAAVKPAKSKRRLTV